MGLVSCANRFLSGIPPYIALAVGMLVSPIAVPARGQVLTRLGEQIPVRDVELIDGRVWIANESGLYYAQGDSLVGRFIAEEEAPIDVSCVKKLSGEIWFGTSSGVFRVVGQTYERVELGEVDRLNVLFLVPDLDHGSVWLGTNRGIYRKALVESGPLERLSPQGPVYLTMVGGELWAGMDDDIYRFDREQESFVVLNVRHDVPRVIEIVRIGDFTFLRTTGIYGGFLYQFQGQAMSRPTMRFVYDIARVGDELWFSSRSGVARVSKGRVLAVEGLGEVKAPVNGIAEIGGVVWLGTTDGVYRRPIESDEMFHRLSSNVDSPSISSFAKMGDEVWAWGHGGVFRVVEEDGASRGRMTPYLVMMTIAIAAVVLVVLPYRRRQRLDAGKSSP